MSDRAAHCLVEEGLEHHKAGRLDAAERCYREALELDANDARATHLLGVICLQCGRYESALRHIERSIALDPTVAFYHSNLAEAFRGLSRLEEAIAACRRSLELDAGDPSAWNNLGIALAESGRYEEATAAWRRCNELAPDDGRYYTHLGISLHEQGRLAEAIACLERAIAASPQMEAPYAALLGSLKAHELTSPAVLYQQHLRFAARFAEPLKSAIRPHENRPDPDRVLRIGYVSPDFREHSVAWFLEPILEHHDRGRFHVCCYSNTRRRDDVTGRFVALADVFRDIVAMTDEQAAELIRADGIDILVDLAGHTAGGRWLIFARKPAPVQVSYLGDACTSGLSTMDYRITDGRADPPGMTERFHTERLARLPRPFLCYRPPATAPAVGALPADREGHITFGSFNQVPKLTPVVLDTWARILLAVPDARLLLKSQALGWGSVAERVVARFEVQGVPRSRLTLMGRQPRIEDHLAVYSRVDIALDSFPYNGTTTTCEALWMGVPVIALAGDSHISRVGVSILGGVGLEELIAATREDYARLAAQLAGDRQRLRRLRGDLRERLSRSPLLDGSGFARALEAEYRRMWRQWCAARHD